VEVNELALCSVDALQSEDINEVNGTKSKRGDAGKVRNLTRIIASWYEYVVLLGKIITRFDVRVFTACK
jgi:hypothetical protein